MSLVRISNKMSSNARKAQRVLATSTDAYQPRKAAALRPKHATEGRGLRTIRVSRKQAQKLVELGHPFLGSKGDAQAEGVAVEPYLADSL
jgi:hypothetical protein